MSKKFSQRFYYDWVLYVAVTLVSVALWYVAFGLFNAPTPAETLYVFFAGTVTDTSVSGEALDVMKPHGVKVVELNYCDPTDGVFDTKYKVVALNACDVVILPGSIADKTDCKSTFAPISGYEEGYSQGGVVYGAYLTDGAKEALKKYFAFTNERYAVFIVASSVNAGAEGSLTDTAVTLVGWLISYG